MDLHYLDVKNVWGTMYYILKCLIDNNLNNTNKNQNILMPLNSSKRIKSFFKLYSIYKIPI